MKNRGKVMSRLNNTVILITGAAQGIGQACANLCIEEGADVIVTDINDKLGMELAKNLGDRCVYRHLDVENETEWLELCAFIRRHYGRLDGLVNNAGITGFLESPGPQDPEHFDMESWRKVIDTNLTGTALGCKYGIQLMKESAGASIVNISSRSGIVGIPGAAAYAASKAAVRNHSKTVALYCAQQGYPIRCNSVHPAAILTPIWDAMLGQGPEREKAKNAIDAEIPLGYMGSPIDVAYAVVYLLSKESRYMTGSELHIDGGILAGSSASPKQN